MNRMLALHLFFCFFGRLAAAEPSTAPEADKPPPKVFIIGDSISMAYTPIVQRELAGKAEVSRPKTNCGETRMGLRGIDAWLGDTQWNVIHFNWGLWDLCYRNPKATTQGRRDKVRRRRRPAARG